MRSIRFPSTSVALAAVLLASGLAGPLPAAAQETTAGVDLEALSAMEARSIGPAAMSGRIGAIDGVSGGSTLYAGAATGGVWKSTDAGTTWEPIFDDQPASSIGAITIHPENPDIVWVGTGEVNVRNSSGVGRGVWVTRDGGESWERAGLADSERIHRIAVHPDDPDVAWVAATGPLWSDGGQRGVYRTTDAGESWERVLEGENPRTGAVEVVVDPENPHKLFASTWEFRRWPHFFESGGRGSALWVSHDGGDSWEEVSDERPFPDGPLGRIGVDVAPSDPDVVYALVEAEKSQLLRSEDGGESWRVVNDEPGVATRPFYYGRIMVDPANPDRIYNIHGTLQVSADGGRTFEGAATWGGGVHVDHHALWIDPANPDVVVDGNDGGVYISRDRADSWRFVTNLPLSQFYEIDVDDQVPYHVYGGLQDNGSWRGPAEVWEQGGIRNYHWEEIGFGDGFHAVDDPDEPRYAYSESQEGFLNRVDLLTGERKDVRPVAPADSVELRFNWNAPLALDPHRENTVYFGSQHLHRSTDDGLTWEVISPDLTTDSAAWQHQDESGGLTLDVTGAENYTTLYTIEPSPLTEGVIWTGSDDGKVHVTRDGGGSWTDLTGRIPDAVPEHAWVSHIEASPHEAGTAFVAFHAYMQGDWGTYVYRVDGWGEDWTRLADEGIDGFARVVIQDPEAPELLFVGGEFGLWLSLDGGDSWAKWTHGLPTVPVRDLEIQAREADLVIGTHGRGAYVLDDLRPLRELARRPALADSLHLFETPPAWQHEMAAPKLYRFDGDAMFRGENAPYGARLTFVAALPDSMRPDGEEEAPEGPSATAEPGGPPHPEALEDEEPTGEPEAVLRILRADTLVRTDTVAVEDGLNRVTWDLRRRGFRTPGDEDDEGPGGDRMPGPEVLPGDYTAQVAFLGDTAATELEVRFDPRDEVAREDRRAKMDALTRAGRHFETVADAVERIREARRTVDEALSLAARREVEGLDSLRAAGERTKEALAGAEEAFVGPDEDLQGITASAESVANGLGSAYGGFSSSFDAPTEANLTQLRRAEADLREAVERTNRVFAEEVADFRERVREAGLAFFPEREPLEAGVD